MISLINLFETICSDVENELKGALRGFQGLFIQPYLPQNWIFKTECETVTFSVDKNGNTAIANGACITPDVTIDVNHEYLSSALQTRTRPTINYQWFTVECNTTKGKTAFSFLRNRLGL